MFNVSIYFFEGEGDHSRLQKNLQEEFVFFLKIFFGTTLDKFFRHKKSAFPSENQEKKSLRVPATSAALDPVLCPSRPRSFGSAGICVFPTTPRCTGQSPPGLRSCPFSFLIRQFWRPRTQAHAARPSCWSASEALRRIWIIWGLNFVSEMANQSRS